MNFFGEALLVAPMIQRKFAGFGPVGGGGIVIKILSCLHRRMGVLLVVLLTAGHVLSCPVLSCPVCRRSAMATFELYRRSTIGMCLTETLDEMVSSGTLSPELAIQVLVQFDKSMTEALENQVKSKVIVKGHLHTYRFCDNVWTFILTEASFKNEETTERVGKVKIVACDSKLLSQ
ncbi:hypothetical protein ABZP36_013870 [Zizania latifolia]